MPGSTLGILIALELHSVSEPPFPPAQAHSSCSLISCLSLVDGPHD